MRRRLFEVENLRVAVEDHHAANARVATRQAASTETGSPTGEFDTVTGATILGLLRGISEAGTTVVMATHDPAALAYVDQAYFVESRRLHKPRRDELNRWLTDGTLLDTDR